MNVPERKNSASKKSGKSSLKRPVKSKKLIIAAAVVAVVLIGIAAIIPQLFPDKSWEYKDGKKCLIPDSMGKSCMYYEGEVDPVTLSPYPTSTTPQREEFDDEPTHREAFEISSSGLGSTSYLHAWYAKSLKALCGNSSNNIIHPVSKLAGTTIPIKECGGENSENVFILPFDLTAKEVNSRAQVDLKWYMRNDNQAVQIYKYDPESKKWNKVVDTQQHGYTDNKDIRLVGYMRIDTTKFIRDYNDKISAAIYDHGTMVEPELLKSDKGFIFKSKNKDETYYPLYD
jgi:hypothetical protein